MKEADTDTVTAALDKHPQLFQEELGQLKGVQATVHVDGGCREREGGCRERGGFRGGGGWRASGGNSS